MRSPLAYVQAILPIHVQPDPNGVHAYHASTVLGGGGGDTEAEAIESCLSDMRLDGLQASLDPYLGTTDECIDIQAWAVGVIEGVGGLNDFERYECAVPHVSDRAWAACWVLRCLANPRCVGSQDVLDAIMARRQKA